MFQIWTTAGLSYINLTPWKNKQKWWFQVIDIKIFEIRKKSYVWLYGQSHEIIEPNLGFNSSVSRPFSMHPIPALMR